MQLRMRSRALKWRSRISKQALSNFQSAQQSIEIAELLESRRTDMKNLMAEWEEVSEIIEANR